MAIVAPSPKLAALRVAFDSGMDFTTAIRAAGIVPGASPEAVEVVRLRLWNVWLSREARAA
jgi:hypothetical protein